MVLVVVLLMRVALQEEVPTGEVNPDSQDSISKNTSNMETNENPSQSSVHGEGPPGREDPSHERDSQDPINIDNCIRDIDCLW